MYKAPRDQTFTNMLYNVISLGLSPEKTKNVIRDGLQHFSTAFTHKSFNLNDNYEFWETLGDATLNKCVLWYISRRFPQLNGPDGSDIHTRLKINIIKTESFSSIARNLHFLSFISISKLNIKIDEELDENKMLEDVFEAFTAVLEFTVDRLLGEGVGYTVCYNILSTLLDHKAIALSFDDIMDYKTRVKELFDAFKMLGSIQYRVDKMGNGHFKVEVTRTPSNIISNNDIPLKLGESIGEQKDKTEQDAAKKTLEILSRLGYKKSVPQEYIKFCM